MSLMGVLIVIAVLMTMVAVTIVDRKFGILSTLPIFSFAVLAAGILILVYFMCDAMTSTMALVGYNFMIGMILLRVRESLQKK